MADQDEDISHLRAPDATDYDPTEETQSVLTALEKVPHGAIKVVRIFTSDAASDSAPKAQTSHTVIDVVDRDGHARDSYRPVNSGYNTIIVRPDGVVGAIVNSVAGVEKYLQGVFVL